MLTELYDAVGAVKLRPAVEQQGEQDSSLMLPSLAASKAQPEWPDPSAEGTDVKPELRRQTEAIEHVVMPIAAFRAYDIRGVFGEVLTRTNVTSFGCALGTYAAGRGAQRFLVGRDARLSSPELAEAVIDGLLRAGCDVTDAGQLPTPLLYYGVYEAGVDAGVMVTGSHNPADFNGLKILIDGEPLAGAELLKLHALMESREYREGLGKRDEIDLVADYMGRVLDELSLGRTLKLVVDGANGVAGEVAVHLYESLGCEVVRLHCEPNGRFPNHPPDPTKPEHLADLQEAVLREKADLGIAFDGDGDRVVLVDDQGRFVWPEHILMLLTADILVRHPGVDVLYDVKSSRNLASYILASGGRPIVCRSGHAPMKLKMRETGALLGGEFSGHYFIKERWYGFDDGIYTAARVLELLSVDMRAFSEIVDELPRSEATPALFLPVPQDRQPELMQTLRAKAHFPDAKLIEIDGLRVEFPNGWGLVRESHTEAAMMFRFEAQDKAMLEDIKGKFRELLKDAAPDLSAPF
jgi:phosphomannomutase/phosphoglucomutase